MPESIQEYLEAQGYKANGEKGQFEKEDREDIPFSALRGHTVRTFKEKGLVRPRETPEVKEGVPASPIAYDLTKGFPFLYGRLLDGKYPTLDDEIAQLDAESAPK